VLRDIGLDPEALLTERQHEEALDREEFCEFLKSMWAGQSIIISVTTVTVKYRYYKEIICIIIIIFKDILKIFQVF
jgi:hypothetical protein